jgi:hypothetical protein|tara:strand:+ start:74 stop:1273 length:1200 start_codon:yes stop_codon:yes gene_type:complete
MRRSSVREYSDAMRERYRSGSRVEKGRLLSEFTAVTGYHRKSAIRLLSGRSRVEGGKRIGRPRRYDAEVVEALKQVWETADRICGKRLEPFMGELVAKLQEWEELRVTAEVADQLCDLSASTIDRLLRPYKDRGLRRPWSTTKPGSLLKASIPIRTFTEWNEDAPGFIEVDLVAHCGESTEGFYLNTLTGVDIATCWVECQGVWGKGQDRVGGAVHKMSMTLPFPLLGLDSDNGGEFINHNLYSYCEREGITFTRSRPYKKNDNAHVEQKNWSVVRRLVGYDRYSTQAALVQLQKVHRLAGLYMNFFQPVMKLQHKSRHGARVHKVYDTAKTPYKRLLERGVLSAEDQEALDRRYRTLNPVRLKARLDAALEALWATADRRLDHDPPVTVSSEATYAAR